MVYPNTATLPLTEDILELMEAHQRLIADCGALIVREEDGYSLAQPSPLRFVPSVASGDVPMDCAGD